MPPATDAAVAALDALRREVEGCTRCGLHATRTQAVFGEGDPAADLMFVGEAPGYNEDQQGRPFVGAAGKLLEELLASIGLTRAAGLHRQRPQVPAARQPRPAPRGDRRLRAVPQAADRAHPRRKVICTLGNYATKLLSGDQTGITRVHGKPRPMEIAGVKLYLYPIFHPAAALYTPAMLATLKDDIARLPELLAHARGERPGGAAPRRGRRATTGTPLAGVAALRRARRGPAGRDAEGRRRAARPLLTRDAGGEPVLTFRRSPATAAARCCH